MSRINELVKEKLDKKQYSKFCRDKREFIIQRRININNAEENNYHSELDSLLSKFKQGGELYRKSPIFNATIQMLLEGLNPYEAIEKLILMNERTQEAFEDYVKNVAESNYIKIY